MLCLRALEGRATHRAVGTAALAAAPSYAPHVPEHTLLYALVQAHCPDFLARLEAEEHTLPAYVREEFDAYLRCGVLDHEFEARFLLDVKSRPMTVTPGFRT